MKTIYLQLLWIPLFFLSCGGSQEPKVETEKPLVPIKNSYAQLFSMERAGKSTKLTIYDNSKTAIESYLLFPRQEKLPSQLRNKLIIRTPIKKNNLLIDHPYWLLRATQNGT